MMHLLDSLKGTDHYKLFLRPKMKVVSHVTQAFYHPLQVASTPGNLEVAL